MLRIQLSRERVLLFAWCLGLLVYFFIVGWAYGTVKEHAKGLDLVWSQLPESVRTAIGDAPSITTPGGYFESRGTSLLPIVLGGAVAAHATRRLSGAEQAGELDLVLSLPIRRTTYFWTHWGAGVVHMLSWTAAATLGAVAGMAAAGMDGNVLRRIAFMVVETLPFVLAVHAGALWAGAGLHRRGPGTTIMASALAAAFLIQIVSSLTASMAWLRWFSPYALWLQGDAYSYRPGAAYLAACILLIGTFLPLAHYVWVKKDLTG